MHSVGIIVGTVLLLIPIASIAKTTNTLNLKNYVDQFFIQNDIDTASTSEFPGTSPIEDFEYVYDRKSLGDKWKGNTEGTDIFKINFRPIHQWIYGAGLRTSARNFRQIRLRKQKSHRIYIAVQKALFHLFKNRKADIFVQSQSQIKKILNTKSQLAKADAISLKQILDLQAYLELSNDGRLNLETITTPEVRDKLAQQLISYIPQLSNDVLKIEKYSQVGKSQAAEIQLDEADLKMKTSSLFNGITHFEVRQDRANEETSYRLGVSVPLDFSNDDNARAKARLLAQKAELAVLTEKTKMTLDQQIQTLKESALKVRILNLRISKLQSIVKSSSRASASSSLWMSSRVLLMESQTDLLDEVFDFYQLYLQLLETHEVECTSTNTLPVSPEFWKERR